MVVLCALESERHAVLAALGAAGSDTVHVDDLLVKIPPATGMGNVASAVTAMHAINAWNPAFLLLVGIAAGLEGEVELGDVLVPDKIVGYESGKLKPEGLDPDPDPYRPDFRLLTAAKAVEPGEWAAIGVARPDGSDTPPGVYVGTVHTGEKVIADHDTAPRLRTGWRKTIGVEMEALGVAVASYRSGPGFLMIKAVCDYADPDKGDNWQPYAAAAAAQFAAAVLRHLPPLDGPRAQAQRQVTASYSGRTKLEVGDGLGPEWWRLADYFDIPRYDRATFPQGQEPYAVWEWLERRKKLSALVDAFEYLQRPDLVDILRDGAG